MSTLVKSIKEIEKMDIKYDCPKLFKGNTSLVIPGSYIVMIKQDVEISGMVSGTLTHLPITGIHYHFTFRCQSLQLHRMTCTIQ